MTVLTRLDDAGARSETPGRFAAPTDWRKSTLIQDIDIDLSTSGEAVRHQLILAHPRTAVQLQGSGPGGTWSVHGVWYEADTWQRWDVNISPGDSSDFLATPRSGVWRWDLLHIGNGYWTGNISWYGEQNAGYVGFLERFGSIVPRFALGGQNHCDIYARTWWR